ncbi:LuxR C-terminal-related transcriptional regulator [uncultured Adlercreutzia sp.]|uniref:helix-turn-helix transcriptional regulator n=1 Tax=uncultured Adlercreutzia sp. TaxID=875803 RepID=UPI0025D0B1DC|nr:LuxR C-terminal-related transcriptional regulator [uncultured Adlercreutzia sp.]MCI9262108.1 hypothetical protein [Eggerthellaceae bacterium]
MSTQEGRGQYATRGESRSGAFDPRLLGLGLYWAWLFLTFYTPVLFPLEAAAADSVREAWGWAAWAHALTLVACALLGKRLERYADSRGLIGLTAALCALGTLLVPLGPWLAPQNAMLTWAMSAAGAVTTGVATGWLVLLYGRRFVPCGASGALVNIAAAYALSCALFFLVRMMDPLIAIASVVLLPAASALVLLGFGSPAGEGGGSPAQDRRPSLRINPRIIIPLAALFFFALGGEMFRGFAAPAGAQVDLGFMGDWYLAGGVAGLVVLAAALEARRRLTPERRATIPNLQVVLVIMALSFLCTVLFGASFEVAYAVFGAAFMGCRCIVWAYCAGIAKCTGTSAFTVFGTAQASFALAVVVGVPLSGRLIAAVQGPVLSWDAIACTFLFLIVVVAVVATNQSDFASAWGMVPRSRALEEPHSTASAAPGKAPGAAVPADAALPDGESDSEGACEEDPLAFLQERFGLTPREREVALLLARGRSLPFVQKELHISQGTAQSHLTHIYRKMQVHSRQEFIDIIDKEMPDQNLP